MKTKNYKATNILLIACLCTASACNNTGNNAATGTIDSTTTQVDVAIPDSSKDAQNARNIKGPMIANADSNFIAIASIANMEELQVLQAGCDMGTDSHLKDNAKTMIADHKYLGEKVKVYAAKNGYTIPGTDNDKGYNDISVLNNNNNKGAAWDKGWMDKMVHGNEDAISFFENNQSTVKDPALKTLIADALPSLHAQHDIMKQLQAGLEK